MKPPATPPLAGVFETALYVHDLERAELFYGGVLGLDKILAVPGRQLVFRSGESILLIFDPTRTQTEQVVINGGIIPFHGATGVGHVAFRVQASDLNAWRERLRVAQVPIESEVNWPNGAHSIYFRDPSSNSLELATPTLWQATDLKKPFSLSN